MLGIGGVAGWVLVVGCGGGGVGGVLVGVGGVLRG